MLEKQYGNIIFECDGWHCDENLETNTSDFGAAKNMLDRSRWRARKDDEAGEWRHYCPSCQAAP